jgi:phenylpropionate dioxygenase-like ring-hydroxylating dioxygenase large terminal subunit
MLTSDRSLSSPIDLELIAPSASDFTDAVTLPPECYTSEAFHEFELRAVFEREWLCLGRTDQVPNVGDFYTATVLGEPLIVVRNKDSEIRVLSSVCQHRGMCVTAPGERPREEWLELPPETNGNCRTFRCPYHWWTYDLDGRLIGAPEMQRTRRFKKGDVALPTLRCEVWNGFIFVNFDRDAQPLGPRLAKLDGYLENYRVTEMVTVEPETIPHLPFNWKVMAENFMEGYHPDRLHKGIHDFAPSSNVWYEDYEEGDGALLGTIRTTIRDGGFNPTYRALFPLIDTLTEEQRWYAVFAYVPPTLLLGFQPDSAFWFTVQPESAGLHTLSMAYIFHRETVDLPLFKELLDAAVRGVEWFNNQDLPANTAVQRGMGSRFAARGSYSWQEAVLPQFNRWLYERYRRAVAG